MLGQSSAKEQGHSNGLTVGCEAVRLLTAQEESYSTVNGVATGSTAAGREAGPGDSVVATTSPSRDGDRKIGRACRPSRATRRNDAMGTGGESAAAFSWTSPLCLFWVARRANDVPAIGMAAMLLVTSALTSVVRLGQVSTMYCTVPYHSCRRADASLLAVGGEDGPLTTSFRQRLKAVTVDRQVLAAAEALHNEWGRPRGPRRESEGGKGMVHLGSAYGVRPRFVAAASTEASIPPASLPEVAVIGRSNVGKSSLLNVLTGSSGLARVSDKPGRTTQLCWFEVGKHGNPDAFHLVDMPGYGFALASEKSVEQWAALSAAYLRKRSTLKMVLVLIDSRVGMKLTDVQVRGHGHGWGGYRGEDSICPRPKLG
jgi:hypothetical protein